MQNIVFILLGIWPAFSQLTPIFLGDLVHVSAVSEEPYFYQYSFSTQDQDLIMATVISQYDVFISVSWQVEDSSDPLQQCHQAKMLSCPLLTEHNQYILKILTNRKADMILQITAPQTGVLEMDQFNTLRFDNSMVQVVALDPHDQDFAIFRSQFQAPNTDLYPFSLFPVVGVADEDNNKVTNLYSNRVQTSEMGQSLGPFAQVLNLPNSLNQTEKYIIIITAYQNQSLLISLDPLDNSIQFGSPIEYLYQVRLSEDMAQTFTLSQNKQTNYSIGIVISLDALIGMGSFQINYCSRQYTFLPNNQTSSANIYIPPQQRLEACQQFENQALNISVRDVVWEFGVSIIVSEGLPDSDPSNGHIEKLWLRQTAISSTTQQKFYDLWNEGVANSDWAFIKMVGTDSYVFTLLTCSGVNGTSCNETDLFDNGEQIGENEYIYKWNMVEGQIYSVSVDLFTQNQSQGSWQYYSLLAGNQQPEVVILGIDAPALDVIAMQEFTIYGVNAKRISGNMTIQVQAELLNGNIAFYSACDKDEDGVINCSGHYQQYNWDENQLVQAVDGYLYYGVQGIQQSLYRIKAQINHEYPEPDPQPYPEPDNNPKQLNDGGNRIQVAPSTPYLLYYKAHIIPYLIQFSQIPSCILFYDYLPETDFNETDIPDQCLNLSSTTQIYPQIYILIWSESDLALQIEVIPAELTLTNQPIVLSCPKMCFTALNVPITNSNLTITTVGEGVLIADEGQNENTSASQVTLSCENGKQCDKKIRVALPFGGSMVISDNASLPQVVSWSPLTLTVPPSQPSNIDIFIPLNSFSQINTIYLHTEGCFQAKWAVSQFNISEESFQTLNMTEDSLFTQECNPFLRNTLIEVSTSNPEQFPELPYCKNDPSFFCYAIMILVPQFNTLPLAGSSVPVHITANSYMRNLPADIPYVLREIFGVTYFGLASNWGGSTIPKQSIATIESLSQCSNLEWNSMEDEESGSGPLFYVTTVEPCAYLVAITPCQMPAIFSDLTHYFSFLVDSDQNNLTSSLIYKASYIQQSKKSTKISLWSDTASTLNGTRLSSLTILLSGPFDMNQTNQQCETPPFNCSLPNTTCFNLVADASSGVYELQGSDASLPIGRYNMAIFSSGDERYEAGLYQFALLFSVENGRTVLKSNYPAVLLPELPAKFSFYTNAPNWEFCVYVAPVADQPSSISFSLVVESGQKTLMNKSQIEYSFELGRSFECINIVGQGLGQTVLEYSISLEESENTTQPPLQIWGEIRQKTIFENIAANSGRYQKSGSHCYHVNSPNQEPKFNVIVKVKDSLKNDTYISPIVLLVTAQKQHLLNCEELRDIDRAHIGFECQVTTGVDSASQNLYCVDSAFDHYIVFNTVPGPSTIFNKQKVYKQAISKANKNFSYDVFEFMDTAPSLLFQNPDDMSNRVLVQVIACSGFDVTPAIVGTSNYEDILTAKITDFEDQYFSYGVYVGLSQMQIPGYYYYGIKYEDSPSLNYSVQAYRFTEDQIPQEKWTISDPQITNIALNDEILIVELSPVISAVNSSQGNSADIVYQLYVGPATVPVGEVARCTSLFGEQYMDKLMFSELMNPATPLFKMRMDKFNKEQTKITIMASVLVLEENILRYFYQNTSAVVPQRSADSGNTVNLGLVFLMLVGSIFVFILLRFFYKVWKRRSSRNSLQFELSEQTQPNSSSRERPPNPQAGYGQFVDEVG